MTTKLEKPMKREVMVGGEPHTVTIDQNGVKIVKKGCRTGNGGTWIDIKSLPEVR